MCSPPLLESGEGRQGTYCIFSCDHPRLELTCDGGSWDADLGDLVC